MADNLKKVQYINFSGEGDTSIQSGELTQFCVGVSWEGIASNEKGLFGLSKKKKAVDIDLSAIVTFHGEDRFDHVYSPDHNPEWLAKWSLPKGKLQTDDGAVKHSGDNRKGLLWRSKRIDTETISVDLTKLDGRASQVFIFLNCAGEEDFSQIPQLSLRMYTALGATKESIIAEVDVASMASQSGHRALILGKLIRKNMKWGFAQIGELTSDPNFAATLVRIVKHHV